MASGHTASPNSEVSQTVPPSSQADQSTVPSQIATTSAAQNQNDSEATKIVSSSPGV